MRSPWRRRSSPTCEIEAIAALLEWTERFDGPRPDGFRVSAASIAAADVPGDVLEALRVDDPGGQDLQRSPAARRHVRRGGPGDRLRAAVAASRLGRGLRAEWPLPSAVVARDDRRARSRRGRAEGRGRDAPPGRRHARRRPRARPRARCTPSAAPRRWPRSPTERRRSSRSTASSGPATPTSPPRSSSFRAASGSTFRRGRARSS